MHESGYVLKDEGLIPRKDSLNPLTTTNQTIHHSTSYNAASKKDSSAKEPNHSSSDPINSRYVEQVQSESKSESRPTSARDSDVPRPLDLEEQKEFSLCISIFGNHCVACILSPIFNHREEGMKITESVLKNKEAENNNQDKVVKATFQILSLIAADARERSHAQMISLFYTFIGNQRFIFNLQNIVKSIDTQLADLLIY